MHVFSRIALAAHFDTNRTILVLHTGHVPTSMARPFLAVFFAGFVMGRFALHFTQYAVSTAPAIKTPLCVFI